MQLINISNGMSNKSPFFMAIYFSAETLALFKKYATFAPEINGM